MLGLDDAWWGWLGLYFPLLRLFQFWLLWLFRLFFNGVKYFLAVRFFVQGFELGFFVGRVVVGIEVGVMFTVTAAFFHFVEIGDGGVVLVLESAHVADEEAEAGVEVVGLAPGGDDPGDSVEVFEGRVDGIEVFADGHVEEAVFYEGEAFHAPVEVGDAFDEAEFGFGGGLVVGDEGVHDFVVLGGIFVGEDGEFGGGESVAEGGLGGVVFSLGRDRAFGFGAVAAGGLVLGFGAGGFEFWFLDQL